MTLNHQNEKFLCFFLQFVAAAQISKMNCDEMDGGKPENL